MTTIWLPVPGDVIAGSTVVASARLDETTGSYLTLELLGKTSTTNYVVMEYDGDGFAAAEFGRFENIIEAVRCFAENGGE